MLRNRSYRGAVHLRGEWLPGTHEPLVEPATFQRVQKLMRGIVYRAHELVFDSGLITCAHCGHNICGERTTKKTRSGTKDYVYYFCTQHKKVDHPPTRLREEHLDEQVLALFRDIRIRDDRVRDWFG